MATGRNYQRTGDAFSEMVRRGEGPPTVMHWQRFSTGRVYFARVPAERCYSLRATQAAQAVRDLGPQVTGQETTPPDMAQLTPLLALDWQSEKKECHLNPLSAAPSLKSDRAAVCRVHLTVTQTGRLDARGARVWLICPRCSRRCGVVYASPWDSQGMCFPDSAVTGCRVCLGLTDFSKQRRGCLDWARAVQDGHYRARSWITIHRANRVFHASFARAFRGLGQPLPGK